MTSDLQQARYDHLVRRVGGIIGPGSKVSEALPELFPVISVEQLPPELLLLSDISAAFGGSQVTGAVGEFATIQLENPAGSGKLMTLTSAFLGVNTTTVIRTRVTSTLVGSQIGTDRMRDTRLGVLARPTGKIRTGSELTFGASLANIRVTGGTTFHLTDANGIAILAPGTQWGAATETANLVLDFSLFWTERLALESELNFP